MLGTSHLKYSSVKIKTDTYSIRPETRASSGQLVCFLTVFLALVAIYVATAHWSLPYHIDAATNAISGWYLANDGAVITDHHREIASMDHQPNLPWLVDSPSGPVSQYPPGAALWTAPFYLFGNDDLPTVVEVPTDTDRGSVDLWLPELWPATLGAVLATAGTAAVLGLVFFRISNDRRASIAAGVAFGLSTTAWTVASRMAWTHGPAMLAIALGLLASARRHWFIAGLCFGFAILTRPHLALVAVMVGIGVSIRSADIRPVVKVGLGSSLGLAALIAYNYSIWERFTISGGYGTAFTDQFLGAGIDWYLTNLFRALFDLERGLVIWAPFVALLGVVAILNRRQAPDWANWAALGGILYLLVQYRANRFSGGSEFFGYRYPLEMLTAAAPVLYLAFIRLRTWPRWWMRALLLSLAVGIGGQLGYIISGGL